jgi:hypothetical protein
VKAGDDGLHGVISEMIVLFNPNFCLLPRVFQNTMRATVWTEFNGLKIAFGLPDVPEIFLIRKTLSDYQEEL